MRRNEPGVYGGLNASRKCVWRLKCSFQSVFIQSVFCKMYTTCVSSKLCEFIFTVDCIPTIKYRVCSIKTRSRKMKNIRQEEKYKTICQPVMVKSGNLSGHQIVDIWRKQGIWGLCRSVLNWCGWSLSDYQIPSQVKILISVSDMIFVTSITSSACGKLFQHG